jgi:hypothetical protein
MVGLLTNNNFVHLSKSTQIIHGIDVASYKMRTKVIWFVFGNGNNYCNIHVYTIYSNITPSVTGTTPIPRPNGVRHNFTVAWTWQEFHLDILEEHTGPHRHTSGLYTRP